MSYEARRDEYLGHVAGCGACRLSVARTLCNCPLGSKPYHMAEYQTIMQCPQVEKMLQTRWQESGWQKYSKSQGLDFRIDPACPHNEQARPARIQTPAIPIKINIYIARKCLDKLSSIDHNLYIMKCYFNECSNEATVTRTATHSYNEECELVSTMESGFCASCDSKLKAEANARPAGKRERRTGFKMDMWKASRGMI